MSISPTPWTYSVGDEFVRDSEGLLVAEIFLEGDGVLIKAAPDMRDALKGLLEAEWMVSHDWGGDRKAVLDAAEAALEGLTE